MISLTRRKTFIDFFPVPEFLLLSNTGIAITDNYTKFVQLRRGIFQDRFDLVHATKVDNPKGAVESGLITSPAALVPILKKLVSHYGVRYAHAVLPEERAYLFTTTINWVAPEGIRDAVAFIIEENAPVTLAESVFDFEIIKEDKALGQITLSVFVLPKEIVNAYVSLFESVGIVPISFKLESQAIARALIHQDDKRSHLIINLSWKKTGFYILEDGVVQFSTTSAYSIGGDDLYSNLNDMKAEMRKVLAFWDIRNNKSGKPERKIEKAILCGPGGSKDEFIKKFMSESNIEYSPADIWLNMSPKHHIEKMSFEESLEYTTAIGSVLPRGK